MARFYLYEGDVVGAASALRHAAAISPGCIGALDGVRYQVWARLVNAGAEFVDAAATLERYLRWSPDENDVKPTRRRLPDADRARLLQRQAVEGGGRRRSSG